MKTNYLKIIVAVILLAGIAACSSGRRAFKRGDYDKAVYQAVKRLRSDPDNHKASATLRRAYNYALDTRLKNIERAKNSTDPFKWETIARNYQSINAFYNEIQHCPACLDIIPSAAFYSNELNNARQNAAEQRYQMAVAALTDKQIRARAQEAHQHLVRAQQWVPDYKDSRDLMDEAMFYATLHVLVEPVPSPTGILDLNYEFFNNKIIEYLHSNQINPYVRFYTPAEVQALDMKMVDQQITMRFDQFSLGNIISHTHTQELSKDSVLLNPGDDTPVYGTVKATLKTHEKGIVGTGLLDFKVTDPQLNKVVTQEKFPSEFKWITTWATFNGDERALTKEQKDLLNRQEIPIPNPQFMFEQFAAPLYDQVISKINNYYRNY